LLLGVFVVAWMNLAVQPCLMAMESVPEPVVAAALSAHVDHGSHSPEHDCDHCPPAIGSHAKVCVSVAASDCSSAPDYYYDGRNGPSKLKDVPTFVAIAEFAVPVEFTMLTPSPLPLDCAAVDHPGEPPLNIRFCVFLK
jgi:hypothetical protein